MDKSLALIGCGKAGLSVSLALKSSGWEVAGCLDRNPETAQQGAQWLACPVLKSLGEVPEGTVLLLGVPEAGFTEVDRRIAVEDRHLEGRVVLHLSGALPARALEICRLRGASVGSFHPHHDPARSHHGGAQAARAPPSPSRAGPRRWRS